MLPITAYRLRELLCYDQRTGEFFWRNGASNQMLAGARAGWLEPKGYWRICVDGRNYQAHRLAWLWMMGRWPQHQVDHIDMDRGNNCWSNLREATNSQNQANTRARRQNTSGQKGVYWHRRIKKWQASISIDGRLKFLGYRDTIEEAAALYSEAATHHHGEFARMS